MRPYSSEDKSIKISYDIQEEVLQRAALVAFAGSILVKLVS